MYKTELLNLNTYIMFELLMLGICLFVIIGGYILDRIADKNPAIDKIIERYF